MATSYSGTPAQKNFVWNSNAKDSDFVASFPKAPDMELILIGAELHQDPDEHDRLVVSNAQVLLKILIIIQ
jgi:hypothetical protein